MCVNSLSNAENSIIFTEVQDINDALGEICLTKTENLEIHK